jgi:hypothetical protein
MKATSSSLQGITCFVLTTATLLTFVERALADATNCIPPPSGLVSWWRGEANALDQAGTNNGTIAGNTTYGSGRVGQGFVFDGSGDGVSVGNPTGLQLQDFTIETWIKRASTTMASFDFNGGIIFGYGYGGYNLAMQDNGTPFLGRVGSDFVMANTSITDTNLHHVAVTKLGNIVVFYVDGVADFVPPYNTTYTFSSSAGIGARGDNLANSFFGTVDELSVYNRTLSAVEIQAIYQAGSAGKCTGPSAPMIIGQPTNQTAFVGESASFSVTALGPSLSYQWAYYGTNISNGTNIFNATNATLVVTNVQWTNAGNYGVVVTNGYGSATSSLATLTVNTFQTNHLLFNVDFDSGQSTLKKGFAAVGETTNDFWNFYTRDDGQGGYRTFGVVDNLKLANGSYSAVAMTVANAPGAWGNGSSDPMYVGYIYPLNSNPAVITFTNAPQGEYDLIVYSGDGNCELSVGTVSYGTKTSLDTTTANPPVWTEGVQYLRYRAIPVPTGQPLVLTVRQGVYGYAIISGLQLMGTIGGTNPPTIVLHPTNTVVQAGSNAIFNATAIGSPPLGYQWRFNDTNLLGATDISLTLTNVQPGSAGRYSVVVSNLYGWAASSNATLTVVTNPPTIVLHPTNAVVQVGGIATFNVTATGSPPLGYQWRFNDTNLLGATDASLRLTNVQPRSAGRYSVVVSNPYGWAASSNATLTVTFPPAVVRVGSTNVMAGGPVTVPVTLVANGNENSLGFSLNFSTQRLAFASATLGSGAAGATLLVNTSLIATGRLGIAVALPQQFNFAPGTQQVVRVTFNAFPLLGSSSSANTIGFADQPLLRELVDAQLAALSCYYSNGTVTLAPTIFESDVWPRTNGNQAVSTTDWLQVGRFVARLDTPATTNEFQRADCAPRAARGDGQMKVTDWVQAGRYVAGLDPLAAIGGPILESGPTLASPSGTRQLRVLGPNATQGLPTAVSVVLDAQGDENGAGFTLTFDPTALTYASTALGAGGIGANLIVSSGQAGSGRLGVVLALPAGSAFAAGSRELVKVNLVASSPTPGVFPLDLTDQLVTRCVSDALANEVAVSYFNTELRVVPVNPSPPLAILLSGTNVVLSWPDWAGDFTLQMTDGSTGPSGVWTNAPGPPQINGDELSITLPVVDETKFFRLSR